MGEARKEALKLGFDGSVRLEFHGATVSSDGGLLPYRDLDDAWVFTAPAGATLTDGRTGTIIRHSLTALLRQSIYNRLGGYDDLNDAYRLAVDPVMRQARPLLV
ncbi:MAG: transposase [Planctomycetota bacterium]|nr:transposase [Planctomycetota bacterium]